MTNTIATVESLLNEILDLQYFYEQDIFLLSFDWEELTPYGRESAERQWNESAERYVEELRLRNASVEELTKIRDRLRIFVR